MYLFSLPEITLLKARIFVCLAERIEVSLAAEVLRQLRLAQRDASENAEECPV